MSKPSTFSGITTESAILPTSLVVCPKEVNE
jgi:hypothetical protein